MLALSLAILGGVDTDPRGVGAVEIAPLAVVEAAPEFRLDVDVLRFDVAARIASELGAALYDLDGALNTAVRIGDDNLSITLVGAASVARTRGSFVMIDGVAWPSNVSGAWTPAAGGGARFHLNMDDVESSLSWSSTVEAAHDAAAWALAPIVRSHVAHRLDGELRVSLATFVDDRATRADVGPLSALLIARAASHETEVDVEIVGRELASRSELGWGSAGAGLAWHSDAVDARAWAGPLFAIDARGVGVLDVAGAAELAFDAKDARTFIARAERRPVASPFHARAMANGGSVTVASASALSLLDVGASVSGAFVQVDDAQGGLRGDGVIEVRWPFEIVTAMARVVLEACAFGAVGFARGSMMLGVAW